MPALKVDTGAGAVTLLQPGFPPAAHGRWRGRHDTGPRIPLADMVPRKGGTISNPGPLSGIVFAQQVTLVGEFYVEDCIIRSGGDLHALDLSDADPGSWVEYCLIDGGRFSGTAETLTGGPCAARHCEVIGGTDGIRNGEGFDFDSGLIHHQYTRNGGHSDCWQTIGGNNSKIRNSRLDGFSIVRDNQGNYSLINGNACFQLGGFANPGAVHDVDITDNYANGGTNIFQGGPGSTQSTTFRIRGNRFGPDRLKTQIFPASYTDSNPADIDLSNVMDVTGEPVLSAPTVPA